MSLDPKPSLTPISQVVTDLGFSKKISKNLVFDTVEGALQLAKKETKTITNKFESNA